ncbi:MAG: acyl-CoA dehydrogenase family protein [Archangium sp.]|nr:acyl-CoA dehydrogenase family protein [Archangium sp.]
MSKLLNDVLASTPLASADAADWWRRTEDTRAGFSITVDRAIALGATADRLGYAFLGGYTSAITVLDTNIVGRLGALCATESGGGHPRAIQTTLENGRLNGTKHFVSGGHLATVLLVVAKTGEKNGRPELKVARIAANQPGVTIDQGATLDFVPEIPHGAVTFKDAQVDAVLEGDGYERYLKPFRTLEDLHVFGAVSACLVSNCRTQFPQPLTEQFLGLMAAIRTLGREDPRSPAVHLALAGVLTTATALIDSIDLTLLEPGFRDRLYRDRPLLQLAGRVREQRRVKAWASFS